jgi:O-antigen biosynthesis protein
MKNIVNRTRAADALDVLRREGGRGIAVRAVRRGYMRLGAGTLDFPLIAGDIVDSARLRLDVPNQRPRRGDPLTIGWLTAPPALGSGGHTTMFRMVEALEAAGHSCIIYLYDRFQGSLERSAATIRRGWPKVRAEVRDIADGAPRLDGWVATGWPSAHVLAARVQGPTQRFYFVQDYEPFFYAQGSEYALAEDTYRFGFRCIAVGHMVAALLAEVAGVESDVAEFSCDADVYRLTNRGDRAGVVFYTKPDVARRGYQLGMLALSEFARRHPEQPIHVFGERVTDMDFPVVKHGNMRPGQLNALYNRTIGGLAMSFTNISLVAEEMLAAGTIPVVNDSRLVRADMPHSTVCWADPTPGAIADALCGIVEAPDVPGTAARAAESVRKDNWRNAKATTLAAIESEIYG